MNPSGLFLRILIAMITAFLAMSLVLGGQKVTPLVEDLEAPMPLELLKKLRI